jgi:uncharacterized protein (DUF1810 family)
MPSSSSELERFVEAQAPVFGSVIEELTAGRKRSHWMWFVFPQLKGLGRSPTADFYGIASLGQAQAYWRHPLLGPRLKRCAGLVLAAAPKSAAQIFGSPDDLKLRSCMTLFDPASGGEPVFRQVLERFFDGEPDPRTLAIVGR